MTTAVVESKSASASASSPTSGKVMTMKNVCSVTASMGMGKHYPMHPVKLNQRKFTALVDCGSKYSFIRRDVADKLKVEPSNSRVEVYGADGKEL